MYNFGLETHNCEKSAKRYLVIISPNKTSILTNFGFTRLQICDEGNRLPTLKMVEINRAVMDTQKITFKWAI